MSATTLVKAAQTGASAAHASRHPGAKRTCTCGRPIVAAGECAECRKKRLQRKLSIGASHDPLEHEADRMARHVAESAEVSSSPIPRRRIQRRNDGLPETEFTAPVSVDRALAEPGQTLEPALQADMERRFDFDFSRVRVHVGPAAALSAHEINAEAYTVGRDVVFGAGRYSSGTTGGRQLIAHELTHVIQQSGTVNLAGNGFVQRQEAPGPKRKLTPEEYKKLDPSLQVLTWGPDFIQGLKRSGVTTQLGDVAFTVLEKGFTQSMDNPFRFRSGVMVGIPIGVTNAAISAVTSLAELGWEVAKLWIRLHVTPAAVGAELVQLVKNNAEALLGAAEPLGFGVGQQVSKEASKFGIEFINSSPFDQGLTFGKIIGRIIGEIAMLFVGVGEVSAAAKAVASTRYGRLLLEAMEASRLLKPLVESSEAAKTVRAAKAAEEASGAERALKAAQEAKPEIAAADEASKARPGSESGERAAAAAGKEAKPATASKEVLTTEEAVAEANFVDSHPELIVGETPPRAKVGDHEIVQLPEGVCERHSKPIPVPCPKSFSKKAKAAQPAPSMLQKPPGQWQPDFELGRNMSPDDLAFQLKAGGKKGQGYYVGSTQFDALDAAKPALVEAKNWAADGRIVRALEAQEHWAGWKVVEQAQEQIKAARGFPIEWRVASPEAKKVIEPIFKAWKFNITVVVI